MIPSDIPRAIELLEAVSARANAADSGRIIFICHALDDFYDPVGAELREYVQLDLFETSTRPGWENVLEGVLPRTICDWVDYQIGYNLPNLMRAAWCDKMAYDLKTLGTLP